MFEFHFVEPFQFARLHFAHGLNREIEDDGLFDPFVDFPEAFFRVDRFGRAEFAAVDEFHHAAYGCAVIFLLQQVAVGPHPFDRLFEFVVHDSDVLVCSLPVKMMVIPVRVTKVS